MADEVVSELLRVHGRAVTLLVERGYISLFQAEQARVAATHNDRWEEALAAMPLAAVGSEANPVPGVGEPCHRHECTRTRAEMQAEIDRLRAPGEGKAVGLHLDDLKVLEANCLCFDRISGAGEWQSRDERAQELVAWMVRYANGNANPKWLIGHAFELAYYVATQPFTHPSPVEAAVERDWSDEAIGVCMGEWHLALKSGKLPSEAWRIALDAAIAAQFASPTDEGC